MTMREGANFRLKNIKITTACNIYTICKFVSLLLMSIWCIQHFYGAYTDIIISVINIIVSCICYRVLKDKNVYEASKHLKIIIIIDVIMAICFIDMAEKTIPLLTLLGALYVTKFIVEILFYSDFLEQKKNWIMFNGLIILLLIFQCYTRTLATLLMISFSMLYLRFRFQLRIVNNYSEETSCNNQNLENDSRKIKKLDKRKVLIYIALIIGFLVLGFCRFVFIEHRYRKIYINDNIYQYEEENLMPEWSGFNKSRYGLHNVETEADTGAIYNIPLIFDSENRAWDGKGHFIDEHGTIIINTPLIVSAKLSERQKYIYSIVAKLVDEDINSNAIIGRDAFFDPETFTSPKSFLPPSIM